MFFGIVSEIISAVNAVGIPCGGEFEREYGFGKKGVYAVVGIKKLKLPPTGSGASSGEVRVTVYGAGSDGGTVAEAAKKVLSAVKCFGARLFSAEISEVRYDSKTDRVYCEVTLGCGNFTAASFGEISLFAEEYSVSRAAAAGETMLVGGNPSVYVGGIKAAKIQLTGYAEEKSAARLDALLSGGEKFSLTVGGAVFPNAFLSGYTCCGKSGFSEKITAEFICENTAEISETEEV